MSLEMVGQTALKQNDYQEAVNIFRRAIDEKKSFDGWVGLARAYEGLEDLPTARWACHKGLELDPQNTEALLLANSIEARLAAGRKPYPRVCQVRFRTLHDVFERRVRDAWEPIFVKGINLGLAVPGYFPGEYPLGKTTYFRWFEQMTAAGFNTVRVYTIQSPSFYEALYEYNENKDVLSLLQGIWVEPPEDSLFSHESYLRYIHQQISEAIDILFGNALLPERPGYPNGSYICDVSPYVVGVILGREWEGCPIRNYNRLGSTVSGLYDGQFLSIVQGTPFEVWIVQMLDFLLKYEEERYGVTHPVSTVCWPTLDPLVHPSESQYEDGLLWQGLTVNKANCNENEDVESLDTAKIITKAGNGFFATYHAYPYYPDFMNNDYLEQEKPYDAYLRLLKAHHGRQAVLIAEYGVPGSREVSHWHRLGWHHGGHNEMQQGRVNGEMLKAIHGTGMAGGVLFSWFDEWFKRNWLFMNYELPADRNQLWFNLQDAEQCYGLIAAYPNYPSKKVNLKGDLSEWHDATVLYQNEGASEHRFSDGADASRRLQSLSVQHDEGFLYLALTVGDTIDFNKGHYVIGIDTCDPTTGEFLLPFNLGISSPVGLKFLIHLTGTKTSRILVCMLYDKYLNDPKKELWPMPSREGAWVCMQNKTNDRRISKDRAHFYPAKVFSMSTLRHGSLDSRHEQNDSLSDFYVSDKMIELRIPWGLIMVTDPSSRTVYWKQGNQTTRQTDGIRFVAFSYKPDEKGLLAKSTGKGNNATDMMPRVMQPQIIRTYAWTGWNVPLYHLYEKKSLATYRQYLLEIHP
jgi:hypothetical protein